MKFVPAILLLCSSVAAAAESQSWHLVADNQPPYQDELAEQQGLLSKLVVEALASQHVRADVQLLSWPQVQKQASEAQYASFFWLRTAELERNWFFSEPLFPVTTYLLMRADLNLKPERLDQLEPYRLAINSATSYGEKFDRLKRDFKLRPQVSDYRSLQAVLRNEADVALMDPVVAHHLLSQLPVNAQRRIQLLPAPEMVAQPVYLVCSRNYLPCYELVQQFNQGWQQLAKQGRLRAVLGPVAQ